jgi:hypothetical protein
LALFLAVFLIAGAIGARILSRGAGQQVWAPVAGTTKFAYTFGAGDTTLDLLPLATSMAATSGEDKTVKGNVSLDFGRLNVIVPTGKDCPTVRLNTKARIALGYSGDGESTGVVGGNRLRTFSGTRKVIQLDATLLAGNLNVVRSTTPCLAPATSAPTVSTKPLA